VITPYFAAAPYILVQNVPPRTTFAVIQELIHQDGLRIALSGRDDVLLEPILRLLIRYVADHRFGEMIANVTSIVLGKALIE
jgi:U3 small nucleolar RNA-associated protein 15